MELIEWDREFTLVVPADGDARGIVLEVESIDGLRAVGVAPWPCFGSEWQSDEQGNDQQFAR